MFATSLLSFGTWLLATAVMADDPGSDPRRFGPYRAVAFDQSVVRDVKVEANGDVFLQLDPAHKDKELVVKISDRYFDAYRVWWHGGQELVSPANQGRPANAWTDYVNTGARFIEYWMDGEVFLHLERLD